MQVGGEVRPISSMCHRCLRTFDLRCYSKTVTPITVLKNIPTETYITTPSGLFFETNDSICFDYLRFSDQPYLILPFAGDARINVPLSILQFCRFYVLQMPSMDQAQVRSDFIAISWLIIWISTFVISFKSMQKMRLIFPPHCII